MKIPDEEWFQSTFSRMDDDELAEVNEIIGKLSGGEIKVVRAQDESEEGKA